MKTRARALRKNKHRRVSAYTWGVFGAGVALGGIAADIAYRFLAGLGQQGGLATWVVPYGAAILVLGGSVGAALSNVKSIREAASMLESVGADGLDPSNLLQAEARVSKLAFSVGIEREIELLSKLHKEKRDGYTRTLRHLLSRQPTEDRILLYYLGTIVGGQILARGSALQMRQRQLSQGNRRMVELTIRENPDGDLATDDEFHNYLLAVTTCIDFYERHVDALFTYDADIMPMNRFFKPGGIHDAAYFDYMRQLDERLGESRDKIFILGDPEFEMFHAKSEDPVTLGCLRAHWQDDWSVSKARKTDALSRALKELVFATTPDFGAIFPTEGTLDRCWVFETSAAGDTQPREFRIRSVEGLSKKQVMGVLQRHGLESIRATEGQNHDLDKR